MSRASEATTPPAPPSEIDQTRIEASLMVLSLQEEARIKNSQELIQLLRELQRSTSQAVREIGTAAHQVRDYPVEVLNQHRTRMEQCMYAEISSSCDETMSWQCLSSQRSKSVSEAMFTSSRD